ncbi:transposase [Desmospora profundinema]|uniref:Transposase n=1 Tax=Desmospora profundinema TaxID=1571184 RepID=A0ABU1IU78_9BACL|nr:transposase [Desmospora profundinema]
MGTRHDLTPEQWDRIKPLLPPRKQGRGRPRADDRKTINGILYVLKTGCTWSDMPSHYGSPVTCWRRLNQWSEDGTWEQIWQALLQQMDEQQKLDWTKAFLDGSFVPAKKGERK